MMTLVTALIFTILVMPSFSTALAGDFCITTSAPATLVGKAFKVPSKGKCKPFFGFYAPPNPANSTTGQACTSTDGSHVVFGVTSTGSNDPGFVQWDNIDLSLPGLTGSLSASGDFANVLVSATFTAAGAPCPATVPVP